MITILMQDKKLTCTPSSTIYQYENNTDQIKCILPSNYEGIDLKESKVTLVYRNEENKGGWIDLKISDEMYNDRLQFYNRINSNITQYTGKIIIYLKILENVSGLSLETSETYFNIYPCKTTPTVSDKAQSSYFDQWLIKMNQVLNTTLKIQKDTVTLQNTTKEELDKIKAQIGGDDIGN